MTSNPYAPPGVDSGLRPEGSGDSGNVEDALQGRRDFEVGGLLSRSFELYKTHFGTLLGATFVWIVLSLVPQGVSTGLGLSDNFVVSTAISVVVSALLANVSFGLMLIPARLAAGKSAGLGDAFSNWERVPQMAGVVLLTTVLIYAGIPLLLIPAIYLAVALSMAPLLVLDKGMGVIEALKTSRKALHHVWWKAFAFGLIIGLASVLGVIALIIGLLFTAPFMLAGWGVLYDHLFGAEDV